MLGATVNVVRLAPRVSRVSKVIKDCRVYRARKVTEERLGTPESKDSQDTTASKVKMVHRVYRGCLVKWVQEVSQDLEVSQDCLDLQEYREVRERLA